MIIASRFLKDKPSRTNTNYVLKSSKKLKLSNKKTIFKELMDLIK